MSACGYSLDELKVAQQAWNEAAGLLIDAKDDERSKDLDLRKARVAVENAQEKFALATKKMQEIEARLGIPRPVASP